MLQGCIAFINIHGDIHIVNPLTRPDTVHMRSPATRSHITTQRTALARMARTSCRKWPVRVKPAHSATWGTRLGRFVGKFRVVNGLSASQGSTKMSSPDVGSICSSPCTIYISTLFAAVRHYGALTLATSAYLHCRCHHSDRLCHSETATPQLGQCNQPQLSSTLTSTLDSRRAYNGVGGQDIGKCGGGGKCKGGNQGGGQE
ncbi:hypothetical protein DEU56DRAFT_243041 [Suillus clintonianus]|uniref:uncharacterized protein n=1 Tax=Suillus clintonianus TaxID=1904413 RepID=UPI001B87DAB4|nr:uncharacterized protein DEU56DRAFT_243041 [Suillus clintonianus]KAG2143601.1 hypothetical protein DEU56DRAFT_243041 [Suillus clintonianus]